MVADILKEKERAEFRAKEADAEAKGDGGGQVRRSTRVKGEATISTKLKTGSHAQPDCSTARRLSRMHLER